jgi:hypothetical protein
MISATAHQVIFFAIAFNITSCRFIIRSTSAVEYCRGLSTTQRLLPPKSQTGQIMCEFNRTNHILATILQIPLDSQPNRGYTDR